MSLQKAKQNSSSLFTTVLVVILVLAFLLRFYYFFQTIEQPLWWDEAEYLSIAQSWTDDVPFSINIVRPVAFPFIAALFFWIGLGETALRVLIFFFSITSVWFIYLLGKKMFDTFIGLVSAFLLAIFHMHLFFSNRLLLDLPTLTLFILIPYLALIGYYDQKRWALLTLIPLFMLGVLLRFPFALLGFVLLLYFILCEGFAPFRNKYLWISFFLSLLLFIPYALWSISEFGTINLFVAKGYYEGQPLLFEYIKLLPYYFVSPLPFFSAYLPSFFHILLICFVVGLGVALFRLALRYDLVRKDHTTKMLILLLLLLLVPLTYFSYFHDHVETRFLFYFFPAAFFLIAMTLLILYRFLSHYHTFFALFVILFLLGSSTLAQLHLADTEIRQGKPTFMALRDAGLWLREHTQSGDVILSAASPQMTYYAQRETLGFDTVETFETLLQEKPVRYIVLTLLEKSPEWAYSYPQQHADRFVPVFVRYLDAAQQQPILVIYEVQS